MTTDNQNCTKCGKHLIRCWAEAMKYDEGCECKGSDNKDSQNNHSPQPYGMVASEKDKPEDDSYLSSSSGTKVCECGYHMYMHHLSPHCKKFKECFHTFDRVWVCIKCGKEREDERGNKK